MIAWFAKNGVAANLLMGVILITGIFSVKGLKMELFPNFDLDLVTISVAYPGAAPLEVEDGICKQIEEKNLGPYRNQRNDFLLQRKLWSRFGSG